MAELIQTKGTFKLRGQINGKDHPSKANGYKEDVLKSGNMAGKKFRSIRFNLKTSSCNTIPIELFGMEKDFAYFYNKKSKATKKVDWVKRQMKPPEGFELITPEFDLVKTIHETYKDDDNITIVGDLDFTSYVDKSNVKKYQTKYIIKYIYPSQELLDFDKEDFVETNTFDQTITVIDTEEDKTENKIFINAYIIKYGEKFEMTTFEINTKTCHPDFAKLMKKLSFGDTLLVRGIIHNRIIEEEVNGMYGREIIKDYTKCLEILNVDGTSIELKKYKEEDFVIQEEPTIDWSKVEANETETVLPFDLT
jgi:hypothetical protein